MGFLIRLIVTVGCIFFSLISQATVTVIGDSHDHLTLKITERYVIGDNDTLLDARSLSIEQAKSRASDYAGAYVEQRLVVDDSKITKQQIRVLTAGFLEVVSVKETRQLESESAALILTTTAVIRLTKKTIKDGLEKLRSNSQFFETINALERENVMLRTKLTSLAKRIRLQDYGEGVKQSEKDVIQGLKERQFSLLSKLEENRSSVQHFFSRGTLLQLARRSDREFEKALQHLTEDLYSHFKNSTEISLGQPELIDNGNGTYDLRVFVEWKTQYDLASPLWSNLLTVHDPEPHNDFKANIRKHENQGNKQKAPFSEKLYEALISRELFIQVSTGSYSVLLPISALVSSFGDASPTGHIYNIQYQANKRTLEYAHRRVQNPVIIKGIPTNELSNLASISADVVVRKVDD